MISQKRLFILTFSIVIMTILLSLSKGSTSIPIYQLLFSKNTEIITILWQLRLPRMLTAFICGGLLSLAGSLMQVLLQNPMADPYVLGLSGGAALFTLLFMLLGLSEIGVMAGASLGSLTTIILLVLLSRRHRWQAHNLLLFGVALAFGFSAGISFLLLITSDSNLHNMLFWLSGDLNTAQYPWLGLVILSLSILLCLFLAPGLNILGRGEKEARALGLPCQTYRLTLYLLSSILTGTAVTLAGCIGFVGLVIPHLTRLLVGYDHRVVLPYSVLLGGSLVTLADTFSRTLFSPQQIPVGILLAGIGVPVFIWLLSHNDATI